LLGATNGRGFMDPRDFAREFGLCLDDPTLVANNETIVACHETRCFAAR
jgi:hypothetical protein